MKVLIAVPSKGRADKIYKLLNWLQHTERALREAELLREVYPALQFKKVEGKTWALEPVLKGEFFGVKKL